LLSFLFGITVVSIGYYLLFGKIRIDGFFREVNETVTTIASQKQLLKFLNLRADEKFLLKKAQEVEKTWKN